MATQTVELWDKRQRNAGTYTSANRTVPQGLQAATVRVSLDAADAEDETFAMRFGMVASWDGGETFQDFFYTGDWFGGLDRRGNPKEPPSFKYSTTSAWPTHVRGRIQIARRTSIGLEVELVTE